MMYQSLVILVDLCTSYKYICLKLIFTHFISVWNIYFLLSVADMFYGQMNLIIEVYLIYTVGESFRFHLQIMSSQNCMKEIFKKNRIPLQSNRGLNKRHTGTNWEPHPQLQPPMRRLSRNFPLNSGHCKTSDLSSSNIRNKRKKSCNSLCYLLC